MDEEINNTQNKAIENISSYHSSKLDELMKKALAKHGYIIGENISEADIAKRSVILVKDDINNLVVDKKLICSWGELKVFPVEENGVFKITCEMRFQEH